MTWSWASLRFQAKSLKATWHHSRNIATAAVTRIFLSCSTHGNGEFLSMWVSENSENKYNFWSFGGDDDDDDDDDDDIDYHWI